MSHIVSLWDQVWFSGPFVWRIFSVLPRTVWSWRICHGGGPESPNPTYTSVVIKTKFLFVGKKLVLPLRPLLDFSCGHTWVYQLVMVGFLFSSLVALVCWEKIRIFSMIFTDSHMNVYTHIELVGTVLHYVASFWSLKIQIYDS